jgi:hypothetical protein
MREMKNTYKIEGKRPPGRIKLRRKNNIKGILKYYDVEMWTGFTWLRIGSSGGLLLTL